MATSAQQALVLSQAGRTATTGQSSLAQIQSDLKTRADRGEYDAAFRLGMGYTCGHFGLKADFEQARKYLKIAAHPGVQADGLDWVIGRCAKAFAIQHRDRLTMAFVTEIYRGRPPQKAIIENYFSEYITTSDNKYIPAMFLDALYMHDVELCKKPRELAQEDFEYVIKETFNKDLKACVDNNFMPAVSLMGILYCEGVVDGESNVQKGLELLKKAANEGGDGLAKAHLGKIYFVGLYGVEKNLKEAKRWYTAAAEQNAPGGASGLKVVSERLKGSCVLL
jgi:TPR repeat protein